MQAISSIAMPAPASPVVASRPSLRPCAASARAVRACRPARASPTAESSAPRSIEDDKALAAALIELGFDSVAAHVAAPAKEEPKWWESLVTRSGHVACLALAALVVSPGFAHAANNRSSGRVGGSNFGSRSTTAYSPAPAQQGYKGTPAAPTKAAETSTATAAVKNTAVSKNTTVKNTTVQNTTVNKTTVVNKEGPVHHHHTTVIAAPAPCPVSTMASAAVTAAVVSSMHQPAVVVAQPMAPMVAGAPMVAAAPVVAAPVVVHRPFWTPLTIGLTVAGVFGLAAFLVSRNNKRAEEW